MSMIASWLWNPLLSFIYIELGVLILVLTGFAAWRNVIPALRNSWKQRNLHKKQEDDHARYISPVHGFFAALAASVGVGNLAGVGTAIHLGGPGALFWMWVSALVGMSFRLCSVWLAMRYQSEDHTDLAYATPMSYLQRLQPGWAWIPVALATLLMVKGFITSNLIQSNSVAHALQDELGISSFLVAICMSALVAFVILGGMQRIVDFSVTVAPWMVLIYFIGGMVILLSNPSATVQVIGLVFKHAFTPYSATGGLIGYGVLQSIQFGTSRGIFSHASGIGVAPFLHATNNASKKDNAYLAAFVPVVDTLIVCSVTGLVILTVGNWTRFNGAYLTSSSFQSFYGNWGVVMLMTCLVVFAFTTMISWAYYSERCYQYLGGTRIRAFRWFFVFITFCGPFLPVRLIWSVADIMIGLVIIIHLFPLVYLVLQHRDDLLRELGGDH
ncbi:MAG: sodium:alanine symporter family protein [SAR324 cluster bacterium]|nr:sodium:alanine symporter family protein [SAR324 cluster bacterium]